MGSRFSLGFTRLYTNWEETRYSKDRNIVHIGVYKVLFVL